MKRLLLGIAVLVAPSIPAASAAKKAPPARRAAPVKWVNVVAPTPEGGMRMGNPKAAFKLIEYGSRACPYCARFHRDSMATLQSTYIASGKLSYEFRDFPVHGALDFAPTLLGWCVSPSRYFGVLGAMFDNQQTLLAAAPQVGAKVQAMTNPTPNQVAVAFAEGLGYIKFMQGQGLSERSARACLNDRSKIDQLVAMTQTAVKTYNITGTPTFILNGKTLGVADWSSVQSQLRAAGL